MNMQMSIEQNRLGAQLLVMDALLESSRLGAGAAPSAQDIALNQILRMLAEPGSMSPSGLFDAALLCQAEGLAHV